MAETDTTSPPEVISSAQSLLPIEGPSVPVEPTNTIQSPATNETSGKQNTQVTVAEQVPGNEEDDEVLFVFSAPRPKHKKRRRLESLQPSSHFKESLEYSTSLPPSAEGLTSDTATRRGTTGMVQRLESCHIGSNEDIKPIITRGSSLPVVPPPTVPPVADFQLPVIDPTTEPNFAALHDLPFPESSSMQWWNDPIPVPAITGQAHTDSMHSSGVEFGSAKRKRDDTSDAAQSCDFSDGQISPRANPVTTTPRQVKPFRSDFTSTREQGNQSNTPTFTSTFSNPPMPAWSANWNAFGEPRNFHYRYRSPSSTPLSLMRRTYKSPYKQPYPATFPNNSPMAKPNQAQRPQVAFRESSQIQSQTSFRRDPVDTQNGRGLGRVDAQAAPVPAKSNPSQYQTTRPLAHVQSHQYEQHQASATTRPQVPITMPTKSPPTVPRVENPNDVVRNPSLYKIPAWSSPSGLEPGARLEYQSTSQSPLSLTRTNVQHNLATMSRLQEPGSSNEHSELNAMNPPYRQPQIAAQSMNMQESRHMQRLSQPQSQNPDNQPSTPGSQRKHSPNLIVDIAETCQRLFPFAEVAERHSVPVQKVFDTFSAIIQLPLLRNADDKRRHGSLGKRRQKEYRDAKKAMEKAAAEREALNVGEEIRRGRGRPRGSCNARGRGVNDGLLRQSIMNNSRGNRGG